jgi:hypothetical protein
MVLKARLKTLSKVVRMLIPAVAAFLSGCGANEGVLRSGKENSTGQSNVAAARDTFDRELSEFRTADFTFIYVLRRKDGGPIDSEDRGVIRLNTVEANRRVSADDGKAFIIGTNTALQPQNMTALYARFAIDNYSPPPSPVANTNAASNANK